MDTKNADVRLSIGERIAYMCGDFGRMGFVSNFFNSYLVFYYTNILGISSAAAGTLCLLVTLADAILNPFYGYFCDRTRTKIGTYRPYMFAATIPFAIVSVLCFVAPGFTGGGKLAYAYIVYLLYCVTGSLYSCAYGSISSVMTTNDHEHVVLGSFREYGTNTGGVLLSLIATTLLLKFSGNSEVITAGGIRTMVILLACFAMVCMLACAAGCKERITPNIAPANFVQSFKATIKNSQALRVAGVIFCVQCMLCFKAGLTPYYCQYYLEDMSNMTFIMTCMYFTPLVGLIFVPKLVAKWSSKTLMSTAGALGIVAGAILLVCGRNMILNCVASLLLGLSCAFAFATAWGTVSDCADYGLLKSGVYCPAMVTSFISFGIKFGIAVSQYGVSLLLTLTKYDASLAVQASSTVSAIHVCTGLIPLIFGVLAIIIIAPFFLTRSKVSEIRAELAAKQSTAE